MAAVFVAQDSRHESDHRVDDRHRRDFTPVEDKVADRDFLGLQNIADALIETLIAPAQQQEPFVRGEFFDHFLIQPPPLRGEQNQMPWAIALCLYFLDRFDGGLGLDDHPRAAPEGTIVDTLVFVSTPVSYVVQFNSHEAAFDGQLE